MIRPAFALALILLLLAACASGPSLVPPGEFRAGTRYALPLERAWSRIPARLDPATSLDSLSVDGPLLNRVYVASGLKQGAAIAVSRDEARPVPGFRAAMSELELAEFVADSVAALDYRAVEITHVRPAGFGGVPGVRLDLTAARESGLLIRGMALAAVHEERLDLIVFLAPAEHYYEAYAADVERMFAGVRRTDG